MVRLFWLLTLLLLGSACSNSPGNSDGPDGSSCDPAAAPDSLYKTTATQLAVYKASNCSYTPLFIKGVNLGVATPGKYAGDLETAANYSDFMRWFQLMADAGINVIRVYTLHMDFFYDAVYDFNTAREQAGKTPLYIVHGIWLDETSPAVDLYSITTDFSTNIQETVAAVHGDISLDYVGRPGKGYGTYTSDISKWVLAWIIGREVHPDEVTLANDDHPDINSYNGSMLSLPTGNAAESWITARMDEVLVYEHSDYGTTRPISFSSWPTLDPLPHATEVDPDPADPDVKPWEDSEQIDLANIDDSKAPAGVFYSFHAYPYYPDFISEDPTYRSYSDSTGGNSYLGYLNALKNHYSGRPVIIAEFSVPSSWGNVHSAHSGMHHGGHDETTQGTYGARMLQNIHDAKMGGGMLFAWIDEWWKPTWLTNEFDFPFTRRAYWHNLMAPEQNYGLVGFKPDAPSYTTLLQSDNMTAWPAGNVTSVEAAADTDYYRLRLGLASPLSGSDELLIALDTYEAALGEDSIAASTTTPANKIGATITTAQKSEFLLHIYHDGNQWQAQLYVGSDYDLYGLYGGEHTSNLRSPTTPTGIWNPVKWKTNYTDYSGASGYTSFYALQGNYEFEAGRLQVQPQGGSVNSKDAVILNSSDVEIRLPWGLLQFTDPSQHQVFHDDGGTTSTWQDPYTSTGIAQAIIFNGTSEGETQRYLWSPWFSDPTENPQTQAMPAYNEQLKQSYYVYQAAIAAIGN